MSTGKLDQSLDQIMKDRKPTGGPRRGGGKGRLSTRKASNKPKAAVAAPVGGIAKTRPIKSVTQASKPNRQVSTLTGNSKISVSGLPEDVTEHLIKDYFSSAVSAVKHVILNYGPNGRSRGSATVIFHSPTAAAEASALNGLQVDRRPIKIEQLLSTTNASAPVAPKSLAERMTKPKNAANEKPKPASGITKDANNNKGGKGGRNADNKKKSGRVGRPKPKTADELNAEMDDYWGDKEPNPNANANGTAQPAAPVANDGDVGMADEIL